jgi:lysophospholipase L1-like esterase
LLGRYQITKAISVFAVLLFIVAAAAVAWIWVQGRRTPYGTPTYVALGSSYAAGAGLGPLQSDSPLLCARSINGYPQQLARMRGLAIVDMSCGGAVTQNVLYGGQFFQGAQVRVITRTSRLVTVTVGGNDVGYVGDLSMLAARNTNTPFGRLVRLFWKGPKTDADRHYDDLHGALVQTLRLIHARAPDATVVVATYPTVLPPAGTCTRLGFSEADAATMRHVADQLAAVTRSAAAEGHAMLVDMNAVGAQHNACSSAPWTAGWANATLAPFHPTMLGAKATAEAISAALGGSRR